MTTIFILWPLSIAITGIVCVYQSRKNRDREWKWASLWKPEETQKYCHNLTTQLPEKP
jgi:hypothetical protein